MDCSVLAMANTEQSVSDDALEILAQVQVAVQAGYGVGVPIEGERLPPPEVADAALAGLAPARMVHLGVHVRVEAVLARGRQRPGRLRLGVREAQLHDRF